MTRGSLETALALRRAGEHERARDLLVDLAGAHPDDASIQYETACVHDYLGLEEQAIPYYLRALRGELPPSERRSAYTGLGSTYRALGRYGEAEATLLEGLARFPDANEMKVFLAMTWHNLGRSRQAVEALLMLLVATTSDPAIRDYGRAIAFYAEDVERTWTAGG